MGRGAGALLLAAALGTLAVSCGGSAGGQDQTDVKVVTTTVQIAALAREVAGNRALVQSVVSAGADAHQFEPTASDLKALAGADVILRHGLGLDKWLDDVVQGLDGGRVFTVTEGITLERPALAGAAGDYDPHLWLDPERAKMMVDNIRDALAQADPPGREEYERNAAAYRRVLDETDAQAREIIGSIPAAARKVVTNHDAFGYFARRYGLDVVGAVIPSSSTDAEASARATAALLDTIAAEGVKAVFAESSVNPELAHQLARDAGVTVVDDLYVDSLGGPGSGAETVHGMLLTDARLIAEALR